MFFRTFLLSIIAEICLFLVFEEIQ